MFLCRILIVLFCLWGLNNKSFSVEIPNTKGPTAPTERRLLQLSGDPDRPVTLSVTLISPLGNGPFPLAIFNHGSNGVVKDQSMANYDQNMGVFYFLSRGYAVALPILRGYRGSGGELPLSGCKFDRLGRDNGKDILAVIDQLAKDPKINTSNVVVAGNSFGGWNSLGTGALQDSRVKAIVNFYGGVRANSCKNGDEALIEGMRYYGAANKTPSIWFYGDDDRRFSKSLWTAMHREYTAQGGQADLVAFGTFRHNSHDLLGYSYTVGLFVPKLDAFLSRVGLPAAIAYPKFMPVTPPQSSHYASIDDVAAVPFLNDPQREIYRKFLKSPLPRSFMIVPGWGVVETANGYDAFSTAWDLCRQHNLDCKPYAVNDDVVWTYPSPPPPPTNFAAYEDTASIPYIAEDGRKGYEAFRKLPRPKAFIIAPDGAWNVTAGTMDAVATAVENCNRDHKGCRPYAVDGKVVWPERMSTTQ